MVYDTWALKGFLYPYVGVYVCAIVMLGRFGGVNSICGHYPGGSKYLNHEDLVQTILDLSYIGIQSPHYIGTWTLRLLRVLASISCVVTLGFYLQSKAVATTRGQNTQIRSTRPTHTCPSQSRNPTSLHLGTYFGPAGQEFGTSTPSLRCSLGPYR